MIYYVYWTTLLFGWIRNMDDSYWSYTVYWCCCWGAQGRTGGCSITNCHILPLSTVNIHYFAVYSLTVTHAFVRSKYAIPTFFCKATSYSAETFGVPAAQLGNKLDTPWIVTPTKAFVVPVNSTIKSSHKNPNQSQYCVSYAALQSVLAKAEWVLKISLYFALVQSVNCSIHHTSIKQGNIFSFLF